MSATYNFETLGDERFQQLCQAVLARAFPKVQCMPVGQPDGGRDAALKSADRIDGGSIIFQVKFVKDPNAKASRDLIKNVIHSEKDKVDALKVRGAVQYFLLTNVGGTSHRDVGSIDLINTELASAFGIPAYCWWRDDLERRIDGFSDIKWSYPEITRGTDLLQALLHGSLGQDAKRCSDALRAYMAYQFKYDSQLKFKQIDLQKSILDLFVDVPARVLLTHHERQADGDGTLSPELREALKLSAHATDFAEEARDRPAIGALQLLARAEFARFFPRVVIEGAPGQGKSTITQYLCQTHRLLLLGKHADLKRVVEKLRPSEARIPFRVDLRDYASWVSGRDPFSNEANANLPAGTNVVLEAFLAAQVHRSTGLSFTVDDLTLVAKSSQLLIALDGFDEVADSVTRNRIVQEVSDAAARLEVNAQSVQIIVTSRPTAFANSPGFSHDEWQHIELLSLSAASIEDYSEKWLKGRDADARESQSVITVLREKLNQPHIRDLARNPMQLAILLNLISVQGPSLPDERTALYDKYIDIFFSREAEKNTVVRDHRKLLIQIHGFLAWTLHVEAEANGASGNISEVRLRDLLRSYLEKAGHDSSLVDALFTGLVERVVALVSRVKGTFEFEVQPLREYFAARYLYDTAPYSPQGSKKRGTLPYRFAAIAKNFYWLNVTRFYAGCYSSGELASLLEGIDDLEALDQFRFISHVRQLSLMLLADYVFSQHPRLTDKLASRVVSQPGFSLLVCVSHRHRSAQLLALPDKCGRKRIQEASKKILRARPQRDMAFVACKTLLQNSSRDEVEEFWVNARAEFGDDDRWLDVGSFLGLIESIPMAHGVQLVNEFGPKICSEFCEREDILDQIQGIHPRIFSYLIDQPRPYFPFYRGSASKSGKTSLLCQLVGIFNPLYYARDLIKAKRDIPFWKLLQRLAPVPSTDMSFVVTLRTVGEQDLPAPRLYLEKIGAALDESAKTWGTEIGPWRAITELTRETVGERWAVYLFALTGVLITNYAPLVESSLVDKSAPLCDRIATARLKSNDADWWRNQLALAGDVDQLGLIMLILLTDKSHETLFRIIDEVSAAVERLPSGWLTQLARAASDFYRLDGRINRDDLLDVPSGFAKRISPRLASLLIKQANKQSRIKLYDDSLRGYEGQEQVVLSAMVTGVVTWAKIDPSVWTIALSVISEAYKLGIVHDEISNFDEGTEENLPIEEAKKICFQPDSYPVGLVGRAEFILRKHTGAGVVAVGGIANEDEWFVDL